VADVGSIEEEIIRLSRIVAEAEKRTDADTVSNYPSSDYVGIDPSGDLIDKTMLVARHGSNRVNLETLTVSDIAVKVHRDTAWEFGTMELAGNLGEKRFSGRYRYSHLWVRVSASWLISGSQMTPVLIPASPANRAEPA
jgi:hypothetical protein